MQSCGQFGHYVYPGQLEKAFLIEGQSQYSLPNQTARFLIINAFFRDHLRIDVHYFSIRR